MKTFGAAIVEVLCCIGGVDGAFYSRVAISDSKEVRLWWDHDRLGHVRRLWWGLSFGGASFGPRAQTFETLTGDGVLPGKSWGTRWLSLDQQSMSTWGMTHSAQRAGTTLNEQLIALWGNTGAGTSGSPNGRDAHELRDDADVEAAVNGLSSSRIFVVLWEALCADGSVPAVGEGGLHVSVAISTCLRYFEVWGTERSMNMAKSWWHPVVPDEETGSISHFVSHLAHDRGYFKFGDAVVHLAQL